MKKCVLALLPLLFSCPVLADDVKGVAFVEAAEQSSGMCFSENADSGFACARENCMKNGTARSDCLRVRWCYPAGWSADVFVQHKEGPHWHEYLCGWQSRSDLEAAARIKCEGSQQEWLIECGLVAIWDPEGRPQLTGQTQ